MRITTAILTISTGVLVAACAGPPDGSAQRDAGVSASGRAETEQMLRDWSNQWTQSLATRDISVLERILAPDFIYTIDNGEIQDKRSFIAGVAGNPMEFSQFDGSDIEAHWFTDDLVALTGKALWTGLDADGKSVSGSSAWTNVYLRRYEQWQCIVGHSTALEP